MICDSCAHDIGNESQTPRYFLLIWMVVMTMIFNTFSCFAIEIQLMIMTMIIKTFSCFAIQILQQLHPSLAPAECDPLAAGKFNTMLIVIVVVVYHHLSDHPSTPVHHVHLNPGVPWMASRLEVKQHIASPSQRCWTRNPSDQEGDYGND